MMLVLLLIVLFLSGLLSLLAGAQSTLAPKAICVVGFVIALGLLGLIGQVNVGQDVVDGQWLMEWQMPWILAWNINFHLGLDGLSWWLSILIVVMGLLALLMGRPLASANSYYAAIAWAVFGVVGIFLSADIFLFFVFWEVALVPIYWMLIVHGHEQRMSATMRFIFYTQSSGLILLLSVLGLAYANFKTTGVLTFDYHELVSGSLPEDVQRYLLAGFLLAFLIKLPAFPFHGWMPALFTEAPAPIVVVGILVKTAVFGLLRFSWPLFPEASVDFSLPMMCLGVMGIVYGAVLAFGQSEPRRVLAYGTLSHVGLLLVGVFCPNQASFFGVVLLLITQALSTGGLLMLLSYLYPSGSKMDLAAMGGLWDQGPKFSVMLLGFLLAGIGFPASGNFVGEWLILWGTFADTPIISVFASLGIILGAVYSLWLFQRLCWHKVTSQTIAVFQRDLTGQELTVYGLMMIALLGLGLYPGVILDPVRPPSLSFSEPSWSHKGASTASFDQHKQEVMP